MPEIFIGCSGFSYYGWKKRFYPEGLVQKEWLSYYSNIFSTVELNVTFYRLPTTTTFKRWANQTPSNFSFALKGSRLITHLKRLADPEESLKAFFERASILEDKLKVVLWQFPPGFKIDTQRFINFLKLLSPYKKRCAFEFRDKSWINDEIVEILRHFNAAFCMADWPYFIDDLPLTSDFAYIRRHGHEGNYATCYTYEEISKDAERIKRYLQNGKDVFIYFNNDAYAYAPQNALQLIGLLRNST
ncbi:MAG TPA: DUF72 domain-containing protein [Syntrophorhabdaceae bacterium]|nr:DUF72 domain-containing protein [Syntrophorhabdaceae bacterium]